MSNKKQAYKAPLIEQGAAPPRYQPPPQVTTAGPGGILKHYPPSQAILPPYVAPAAIPAKDGKNFTVPVIVETVKQSFPTEPVKYYPPQPVEQNNKLSYPVPLKYPSPPSVIQPPPPVQRRAPEDVEMLKFVRKSDGDAARAEQNRVARESARRIQGYVAEVRALKEANQRLGDDNQELRDLCCFLDDDRQKGRKLAREWQRFGRYTASVMRQEVSAYQNKLRQLDNKQQELIKDNLELKELCLYLDEERSQTVVCPNCGGGLRPGPRDDGDGSSSSTNADEPVLPSQFAAATPRRTESHERLLEESIQRQRTVFNDQMMLYVRSLEQRVKQLEEEKLSLQQKFGHAAEEIINGSWDEDCGGSRPEAVVQALQVLEVREKLERDPDARDGLGGVPERPAGPQLDIAGTDLDDGEKALVREMCNVVWRKLEEGPAQRR